MAEATEESADGAAGSAKAEEDSSHQPFRPYQLISQAGQQVLGLLSVGARAAAELTGALVGLPLRTACGTWTGHADSPSVPSAVEGGATTVKIRRPAGTVRAGAGRGRAVDDDAAVNDHAEGIEEQPEAAEQPEAEEAASPATVEVTFRLPAAVHAGSAQLCGDFNDWSVTADPMNRLDDGSFEVVRALPVGRRWRFRYLLDGNRWENDWAADDYPSNAFGDHDSVVDLRAPSTSRMVNRDRPAER